MLATDLLLLALDDDKGTVHSQASIGLDFGLAGAIIMDLALRGAVRLEGKDVFAATPSVTEPLLNEALHVIAAAPGKSMSRWVHHLSHDLGGLRKRLLDTLVAQGTLQKREKRVLLVFHWNVYPERNTRVEHDIRARLDAVLLQGAAPDPETTCLIHLAAASHVTDALYAKAQRKQVKARIAELDDAAKAGADAVTNAVVQAQAAAVSAATTAAIVAATVSATTAAATAACSASTAACT